MNTVFSVSTLNSPENVENMETIVSQAKAGNSGAFGQIYDLYFKRIYQFVYYRVGHKEIAEDLTEDIFIKAHSKISSISAVGAFEGWLYQIARNTVIDYYRQKKSTVSLDEVENTLEYDTNIIDSISLQEQQKVLLKLMKYLTADQQQVVKMKFLEDLENETIATLLHKSEGAIRVIQHRAVARLQELIKNLP